MMNSTLRPPREGRLLWLFAVLLIAFTALAGHRNAEASTGNNFTMLDGGGGIVGGTNDVTFTWDGTLNTDVATAVENATISSPTPFFGLNWTAHDVKIYGPGTYTIDTIQGGSYTVTAAPGQVMVHMLFDWGVTADIDVINVWDVGTFGPSTMFTAAPTTTDPWSGDAATVWTFMSTDWDGNGINGAGMIDGAFPGFNANFNVVTTVSTTGNNFTMLDGGGGIVGGTNDVTFTWDGTLNTDVATAVENATISSPTPFFGLNWTAHDVKLYGPGTYTIDTIQGGSYTVTAAPGQVMVHMLFDWGVTADIDVIDVWDVGTFGPSTMFTAAPTTTDPWSGDAATVWTFMSTDWDGNGINGAGMIDGAFPGFNANFNVVAATGTGGGGTTNPATPRTPGEVTIDDPGFGGGAAAGWWTIAGLLGLLGMRRRAMGR